MSEIESGNADKATQEEKDALKVSLEVNNGFLLEEDLFCVEDIPQEIAKLLHVEDFHKFRRFLKGIEDFIEDDDSFDIDEFAKLFYRSLPKNKIKINTHTSLIERCKGEDKEKIVLALIKDWASRKLEEREKVEGFDKEFEDDFDSASLGLSEKRGDFKQILNLIDIANRSCGSEKEALEIILEKDLGLDEKDINILKCEFLPQRIKTREDVEVVATSKLTEGENEEELVFDL